MKILFAAGGTAGHINPALAAAGYIREQEPEAEILFVGTADKMESRLVPAAGFDFQTIEISGFQRKLSLENIKRNVQTVLRLLKATGQSKRILEQFQPDVVVGFGGYVSGPVLREAAKMGIPTAIHEQNAYPGVTNKALAKTADQVMLTVADAEQYLEPKNPCVLTGLPVRGELLQADREFARAELGFCDSRPVVLSTGGSLGARAVNEAMVSVITAHDKTKPCYHIHAMGQYGLFVLDELQKNGVDPKAENLRIREYIDDMDRCYAAADVVVGRAGASSLSELQALGKAAILIPSPNVAENHQYHNAMAMVNRGAAEILEEKDLSGQRLTEMIDDLLAHPESIRKMEENAGKMAIPDAREQIARIVLELGRKGKSGK